MIAFNWLSNNVMKMKRKKKRIYSVPVTKVNLLTGAGQVDLGIVMFVGMWPKVSLEAFKWKQLFNGYWQFVPYRLGPDLDKDLWPKTFKDTPSVVQSKLRIRVASSWYHFSSIDQSSKLVLGHFKSAMLLLGFYIQP